MRPLVSALRWDGDRAAPLSIVDQTLLPGREAWIALDSVEATIDAISRLAIRGAPNIGIVAAHGLALAISREPAPEAIDAAAERLRAARPTAVNLAWAVDRVRGSALAAAALGASPGDAALDEAAAIHAWEDAASEALARHGADHLAGAQRILTHCNTGALACGGEGSALAVVFELARRGDVHVLVCETRPLLQGARLTVWELQRAGLSHELLVDGAAAGLIRRGEVDAVIVGCDRVAANGDVANKVGTYAHALAASAAQIPFVVAGPTSTIDSKLASGDDIEIEERAADEVRHAGGTALTVPGTPCRNPAFDVTPAALVSALVTERGVASPVDRASVAALVEAGASASSVRNPVPGETIAGTRRTSDGSVGA